MAGPEIASIPSTWSAAIATGMMISAKTSTPAARARLARVAAGAAPGGTASGSVRTVPSVDPMPRRASKPSMLAAISTVSTRRLTIRATIRPTKKIRPAPIRCGRKAKISVTSSLIGARIWPMPRNCSAAMMPTSQMISLAMVPSWWPTVSSGAPVMCRLSAGVRSIAFCSTHLTARATIQVATRIRMAMRTLGPQYISWLCQ